MKTTGIVRRTDDLARVVIPKEIRCVLRIRESDPMFTTLTPLEKIQTAIKSIKKEQQSEADMHPIS